MSDPVRTKAQIAGFEGCKLEAYPDPVTHADPWTIGYGHTGAEVHEGLVWTQEQADAAFDADYTNAEQRAFIHWSWIDQINDARQAVIIGMVFQMGVGRLGGFIHMLAAAQRGDFDTAADQMEQSDWARQTPARASTLAKQMRTGEWQS